MLPQAAMKDFDFDQLHRDILAAARQAFADVLTQRSVDDLSAFALYSDSGAMTVCPAMCTTRFLAEKARSAPDEYLFYKYSPSEWPLEGAGAEEAFGRICRTLREHLFHDIDDSEQAFQAFQQRLMETCVQVQAELRQTFFAERADDFLLLVTISDDDEPAPALQSRVRRLNNARIADEFDAWARTWATT